ncbi:MAG: hypothetical protein IH986_18680 [Planctomycetes bacterium]|nr:hypothetical protein [Planctomycetota bacterium]
MGDKKTLLKFARRLGGICETMELMADGLERTYYELDPEEHEIVNQAFKDIIQMLNEIAETFRNVSANIASVALDDDRQ